MYKSSFCSGPSKIWPSSRFDLITDDHISDKHCNYASFRELLSKHFSNFSKDVKLIEGCLFGQGAHLPRNLCLRSYFERLRDDPSSAFRLVLRQLLKTWNMKHEISCITYSKNESIHCVYRFFSTQPIIKKAQMNWYTILESQYCLGINPVPPPFKSTSKIKLHTYGSKESGQASYLIRL